MPEMLWAVLLTGVFDRKDYLVCLRRLAILCRDWFKKDDDDQAEPDTDVGPNFNVIVDHTHLAEISDQEFRDFIAIPLKHPLGYAALRPLLLLQSLPGRERWEEHLSAEPTDADWQTLANAVAGVIDHQSEASTDIRWFKFIVPIISGRVFFPDTMSDDLESIRLYPDHGDMRKVRPFIRSGEMTMRRNPTSAWVAQLWSELLEKTGCIDASQESEYKLAETTIDPRALYTTRSEVTQRFLQNLTAVRSDARLDSSFGLLLYTLSIVEEIGFHRVQTRIIGRHALRAIVEANITLKYLVHRDDDGLWKSFRVWGAGQAKLAFLKAQELEGDLPSFLDEDSLYAIANEDLWQEFLDIDIGHWVKSNLRTIAIDCGAKDLYDRYYDWASAYIHGHWGAIRDTNFVTCHNPLHRLHRIPRLAHRSLNSVEADAIDLVNSMLDCLDAAYPGEKALSKLSLLPVEHPSPPREES